MLIGNDEKILKEMQTVIEDNFNHAVIVATTPEEVSAVDEVSLIISYADMKFIDGVKFLAFVASEKKFEHVPFVLTTADKLVELFNAFNSLENDTTSDTDNTSDNVALETTEPIILSKVQDSTIIHDEKKRLAKVVTNFIGYELDLHV